MLIVPVTGAPPSTTAISDVLVLLRAIRQTRSVDTPSTALSAKNRNLLAIFRQRNAFEVELAFGLREDAAVGRHAVGVGGAIDDAVEVDSISPRRRRRVLHERR